MKLYISPGACSLAPHIVIKAIGKPCELQPVDLGTKKFSGGDFYKINPKGSVPVLEITNDKILTECAVILQYLADQSPEAELFPKFGTWDRYVAMEWLHFVATELHKTMGGLFGAKNMIANEEGQQQFFNSTVKKLAVRFDILAAHLEKNPFILGSRMSIIDAYIFTILSWSAGLKVSLEKWPTLISYINRMSEQPAVQAALIAERSLGG